MLAWLCGTKDGAELLKACTVVGGVIPKVEGLDTVNVVVDGEVEERGKELVKDCCCELNRLEEEEATGNALEDVAGGFGMKVIEDCS